MRSSSPASSTVKTAGISGSGVIAGRGGRCALPARVVGVRSGWLLRRWDCGPPVSHFDTAGTVTPIAAPISAWETPARSRMRRACPEAVRWRTSLRRRISSRLRFVGVGGIGTRGRYGSANALSRLPTPLTRQVGKVLTEPSHSITLHGVNKTVSVQIVKAKNVLPEHLPMRIWASSHAEGRLAASLRAVHRSLAPAS